MCGEMDNLITLAEFDNARSVEPMDFIVPSNISINIKILESGSEQALSILESIKKALIEVSKILKINPH